MINFLYLPLTIALFIAAKHFQQRFSVTWLNPVLITLTILVIALLALGIPFADYNQYSGWLSKLLEPAVVALGVPLYKQLYEIKSELPRIAITILVAAAVAISSTVAMALMVGASPEIAASLAPKSVTTPIAVLISEQVAGEPALTAIAVLITGLVGAVVGIPVLKLCGVHSSKAQGIAMGTACHALGTARIAEEGHQHGAYSALALVLSATFSALLCPLIVPLFA
ncbi:LrgB family protein [Agarivorans sp. 1_MG-2023]|uniref:LrgB family protein n=1 Tax=Agarivorans sp. 1_MG-2023 TaxID=3062634 RepID=UPI0026E1C952|nr:LrgB family protein [Agarivorans sp. 1_MG-2023]MDO6764666.1 LrgB family protein [Agarivorans sp. 1_MG-2023]